MSGWDVNTRDWTGSIDELEDEVIDSLDEAALAGAKVLGQALSSAAPSRTGDLSASFQNVRKAEARWRTKRHQGLARIGPMKFYGPMLEAGRTAGTSVTGHKYPSMPAYPFIHRTDRATRGRVWDTIRDGLPDTNDINVSKGRKR